MSLKKLRSAQLADRLDQAFQLPLPELKEDCRTIDLVENTAVLYLFIPPGQTSVETLYRPWNKPEFQINPEYTHGHSGLINPNLNFPERYQQPNPTAPIALRIIGSRSSLRRMSDRLVGDLNEPARAFRHHVENRLAFPATISRGIVPFDPFNL
jgi:hypothetical protein